MFKLFHHYYVFENYSDCLLQLADVQRCEVGSNTAVTKARLIASRPTFSLAYYIRPSSLQVLNQSKQSPFFGA